MSRLHAGVITVVQRPPFVTDAIQRLPDGRVRLDIARRGRSIVMACRAVYRQAHRDRSSAGRSDGVVRGRCFKHSPLASGCRSPPARRPEQTEPGHTRLLTFTGRPVDTKCTGPATPSKIAWAQLLARVFAIDVLTCPRLGCGGKLKATAAVLQSREIALLLYGARGPAKPSPPGQLSFLNFGGSFASPTQRDGQRRGYRAPAATVDGMRRVLTGNANRGVGLGSSVNVAAARDLRLSAATARGPPMLHS